MRNNAHQEGWGLRGNYGKEESIGNENHRNDKIKTRGMKKYMKF